MPGVVEAADGLGPAQRSLGLAHRPRTLDGNSWQSTDQYVQLVINDPGNVVVHTIYNTDGTLSTLLIGWYLRYKSDAKRPSG